MSSIILLALLALIWGSSFILMKRAMFDAAGLPIFSAEQVAALRITFAGLFLVPFGFRHLKELIGKNGPFLIFSGLVGSTIPAFLFTEAQQHIDSALAGMLNALTPIFTFLMGVIVFGVAFRKNGLIGVLIGLVGAMGLVYFRSGSAVSVNTYGLLIVLATLCYGTNINVIKKYLSEMSPLRISALSLMVMVPFTGLYALKLGTIDRAMTHPEGGMAMFYIILLALFSTAIGLILFNRLIKEVSALFASSVTYFIPIAAIGWGVLDGEKVTVLQVACIGLILLGVWYVSRRKLSGTASKA